MKVDVHNGHKVFQTFNLVISGTDKPLESLLVLRQLCDTLDERFGVKFPILILSPRTDNVSDRR